MLWKCFGKSRLYSTSVQEIIFCLLVLCSFLHTPKSSVTSYRILHVIQQQNLLHILSIPSPVSHHITLLRACCSLQNYHWPYWKRFNAACLSCFLTRSVQITFVIWMITLPTDDSASAIYHMFLKLLGIPACISTIFKLDMWNIFFFLWWAWWSTGSGFPQKW